MNPDVAAAVSRLEREGVLSPEQAAVLQPVAEGKKLSAYGELRFLFYVGVLLITAGVGFLVQENLEHIGPLTIAIVIGIAAAGCLFWVHRHAPPFSWGPAVSTHLAFDYVLLLGVLLLSADLAYVETQFTPLGEHWSWHLFWMSLFMTGLSLRYDSRVVFSLALSTFAAWRGVSTSSLGDNLLGSSIGRTNALVCGIVFVLLGAALARWKRKPHFEPVAAFIGWLLVVIALFAGAVDGGAHLFRLALLATGCGLATYAYLRRRFWLFVMGVLAGYVALSILVVDALDGEITIFFWFFATSIASLFGLIRVHRTIAESTP
jgi:hypothetical protein